MTVPPILQPADLLFYNTPSSLVDLVIRVKTWSMVAHVEIYVGKGQSVASRNFVGVSKYALRREGLVAVLRPNVPVNVAKAMDWFATVNGEKYDMLGLLCFTLAVKQGSPDKMFCSEFAKRWFQAGDCPVLSPRWDADKTAPGDLMKGTVLDWLWLKDGAF